MFYLDDEGFLWARKGAQMRPQRTAGTARAQQSHSVLMDLCGLVPGTDPGMQRVTWAVHPLLHR